MRLALLVMGILGCAASASPEPTHAAPLGSPTAPSPTPPSLEAWVAGEPILREVMRDCRLAEIGERWARDGSRCIDARSIECSEGGLRDRLAAYCTALHYGEVHTKRFKIDTDAWCDGPSGGIAMAWPWRRITFRREVVATCEAIVPAWVARDVAGVRAVVNIDKPLAAAEWKRAWEPSIDTWELEWTHDAIDEDALDEAVRARGYPLVSDQVSYRLWSRRQPHEYSFTVAKAGYRDNRLIVARWAPTPPPANLSRGGFADPDRKN